jgi:glycosyltransferase involved in cell wall biosynthesis
MTAQDQSSIVRGLRPTVTIVICTYHRAAILRKCLEAIKQLDPPPDEVIVVDNTPGDLEAKAAAREYSVQYAVEPLQGLGRARNRGFAESKSDVVAYLDDDALPDREWLNYLLEPFAEPEVAVVAGKVVTPQSRTDESAPETPVSISNKDPQWFVIAAFGGVGMGGNMAVRKVAASGGKIFDERLGRGTLLDGFEDNRAFVGIVSRGFRAVHMPAAIVSHPPLRTCTIERDGPKVIVYWLLLFLECADCRVDLMRFLYGRLRHKPLTWKRDPLAFGPLVRSGWQQRIKAGIAGILLYIQVRKYDRPGAGVRRAEEKLRQAALLDAEAHGVGDRPG